MQAKSSDRAHTSETRIVGGSRPSPDGHMRYGSGRGTAAQVAPSVLVYDDEERDITQAYEEPLTGSRARTVGPGGL